MIIKLIFAFVLVIFLLGCDKRLKSEIALVTAKGYCDCINEKLSDAMDSSVDVNECNYVLFSSRLFSIHFEDDKNERYSLATLDSSNKFFLEVGNTIDTLCLNKIKPKKLKKIPHAPM